MTNQLTIHHATQSDTAALAALVNSAFRGESSKQGWTTEADLLGGQRTDGDELAKVLAQPGVTILKCITAEGVIVACVYLQKKGLSMYLGMLTVSPTLQTHGIGKMLMAAAEQFALEQGCAKVEMTVISVRHELIAWYNKRGYQATGETKPFPVDTKFGVAKQPLEFIVMEKKL